MISKGIYPLNPEPITRVERTVRNGPYLKNLAGMNNPLKNLHISLHAPKPVGVEAYLWDMFLSHAQVHTAQAALGQLPEKLRKKFKVGLKNAQPTWWSTDDLWDHWQGTAKALGLIP